MSKCLFIFPHSSLFYRKFTCSFFLVLPGSSSGNNAPTELITCAQNQCPFCCHCYFYLIFGLPPVLLAGAHCQQMFTVTARSFELVEQRTPLALKFPLSSSQCLLSIPSAVPLYFGHVSGSGLQTSSHMATLLPFILFHLLAESAFLLLRVRFAQGHERSLHEL